MSSRFLILSGATLILGLVCVAACGSDDTDHAHPLERVAASPPVRTAWQDQRARLSAPRPSAPHAAEVRLYYRLRNRLDDPRRRADGTDRFLEIWSGNPAHPLWIDFAAMKRRNLGRDDEVAALFTAAAGTDTASAAFAFVHARLTWGRHRADPGHFLEAVTRSEPGSLLQVLASMRAARTEQAAGLVERALDRLASVLPAAWELGGPSLAGAVWQDLSLVARKSGRLDDALLAAHAADACAAATGLAYPAVRARLAAGRVHLERSEFRAALDTFAACRSAAVDSGCYRWSKDAPGLMARAARTIGDTDLERTSLLAVHAIATAALDTNGLVLARVALGGIERRCGRWAGAELQFQDAYAAAVGYAGRGLRPFIDLERANLLDQQGRYAEAESLVHAGLAVIDGDVTSSLEACIRLVRQGLETDRPQVAYRALAVARGLEPDKAPRTAAFDPVLQLEIVAARLHARQGEHHLATAALTRARQRLEGSAPDAAWYLTEAEGLVAEAAGDPETARRAFASGLNLARDSNNPNKLRRSQLKLGSVLLAEDRPAAAESLFAADRDAPEYWTRLHARLLSGMCRVQLADPAAALRFLTGVDTLLGPDAPSDILSRLRLEQARALAMQQRAQEASGRLVEARAACRDAGASLTEVGRSFNSGIAREIAEETLGLADEHPELFTGESDPVAWTRRLAAWARGVESPPSHAGPLVEFFVGERRAWSWIVPGEGSTATRQVLDDPARLRRLAEAVKVDMSYPGRAVDETAAAALGRLLLGPILPLWNDDTVLAIGADGDLHGLPWAALILPGGATVLDHGPMALVTGISSPLRTWESPGSLLVLGVNSDTDPASGSPLDRAEEEAAAVAKIWPGDIDLRLGEDSRWHDLRQGGATGFKAVHIASHTRVHEGLDGRSTIHIAGLDEATPLTMEEVPLLGAAAELVYLSSCEGGRRHRAAGHGVMSFAEAFLKGGAASVVASTVLVDDDAASRLARSFYGHWLGGMKKAAALRAALLEVRGTDPAWAHPFHWGFTYLYVRGS